MPCVQDTVAQASTFNRNAGRRAAAAEKLGASPRRAALPPSCLSDAVLVRPPPPPRRVCHGPTSRSSCWATSEVTHRPLPNSACDSHSWPHAKYAAPSSVSGMLGARRGKPSRFVQDAVVKCIFVLSTTMTQNKRVDSAIEHLCNVLLLSLFHKQKPAKKGRVIVAFVLAFVL